MATTEKAAPIPTMPAVLAAMAAVVPLRARYDELEQQDRQYSSAAANEDLALDAQIHGLSVKVELAQVTKQLRQAETEFERVRQVEREKLRASFQTPKRQAISKLRTKLMAARDANEELKAIQYSEHEATGEPFDALTWIELNIGPDGTTRLDQWLASVRAYGLD
jgi:hypothetical protein